MITQQQADRLLALAKEAVRKDALVWEVNLRQDEVLVAIDEPEVQFILSLKRNPFEIRLHLRTKDRDIGLVRLDNAFQHLNPDGSEIREKPHLHVFREGEGLNWAEPVAWCDLANPIRTLERFLHEIRARFPAGLQLSIF